MTLWDPDASESTGKEEGYCAAVVTDPDCQGAVGLLLYCGDAKTGIQEIPQGIS